jgi:hypothetical protein
VLVSAVIIAQLGCDSWSELLSSQTAQVGFSQWMIEQFRRNVSNPAQNHGLCPVIVQLSGIGAISGEPRKGEIEWNRIVLPSPGAWLP